MCQTSRYLLSAIGFGFVLPFIGCSSGDAPKDQPKPVTAAAETPKLSEADAALAKEQGTCPVSGDVLGEMGTPYKVTVEGKTVFLCCSGCEEELRKHPEKYLPQIKTHEAKTP